MQGSKTARWSWDWWLLSRVGRGGWQELTPGVITIYMGSSLMREWGYGNGDHEGMGRHGGLSN